MQLAHIYLDEAGQPRLTGGYENIFLVAALRVTDPHPLRQLFRRVRRHALPKRLRHLSEVKANAAPDRFRERLYHGLADLGEDLVIHSAILHTSDVPYPLREYEGILYAHVVAHTAGQCVNTSDLFLDMALDRRRTRNLSTTEFNAHLQAGIEFYLPAGAYLDIHHCDSTTDIGIQAVDFVCWALYQKYQREDTHWYEIIAPRIASERVLFRQK